MELVDADVRVVPDDRGEDVAGLVGAGRFLAAERGAFVGGRGGSVVESRRAGAGSVCGLLVGHIGVVVRGDGDGLVGVAGGSWRWSGGKGVFEAAGSGDAGLRLKRLLLLDVVLLVVHMVVSSRASDSGSCTRSGRHHPVSIRAVPGIGVAREGGRVSGVESSRLGGLERLLRRGLHGLSLLVGSRRLLAWEKESLVLHRLLRRHLRLVGLRLGGHVAFLVVVIRGGLGRGGRSGDSGRSSSLLRTVRGDTAKSVRIFVTASVVGALCTEVSTGSLNGVMIRAFARRALQSSVAARQVQIRRESSAYRRKQR